ncbi:transposase [Staphylococcus aureus]|nr:transposase [Staphylococcus aureus]
MTKERRTFSSEFKLQVVRLYENGKLKNEIIREYDLKPSIFSNSIKQHQNTESFNHQDNLKSDEKELIKLRKEVQHLKMEHVSFNSNIRVDLETELFKDTLLEDSNLSDYIKNQLLTIWRD